jgi:CDP-diacylglycerol--glycerol-3-phosphate 3-phosphatidyltransferase
MFKSWQEYRTLTRSFLSGYIEKPIATVLNSAGFSPNKITICGLILNIITAHQISLGNFLESGILLILASSLDMVDGTLARMQNKVTKVGALFDSCVDRLSEAFIFLGLLAHYSTHQQETHILFLIYVSIISSFMVSYLRARGEGLGVDCKVGFMTRPERIVTMTFGLLLNQVLFALIIISVLSTITSIHRFWHIKNELS